MRVDFLNAALTHALAGARALVLSVSHDRYVEVSGGTQLLIADEQRKFNGDRAAYLHLSPVEPRLGLARATADAQWLNVILDGHVIGTATDAALAAALAGVPETLQRLLAIHALHGHQPERIAALARALRPSHTIYWVHDYGAVCGSPRLLRNDIAFCHAPPSDSMGCRICVHGEDRAEHTARLRALFAELRSHVVAPSEDALSRWLRAIALPHASARAHAHASARVHTHASLIPEPAPHPPTGGKWRVAFVGQAEFHKGWNRFGELVAATRGTDGVQYFQFASPAELRALDGVTAVAAAAGPAQPFGMVQALVAHDIDIVLALSPWPETFGYVAHEALAAGADLLTTAASGNVAALVRRTGRGVVLDHADQLAGFFLGGAASEYGQRQRAAGRHRGTLRHDGSTATLALSGDAVETTTLEPAIAVLTDGEALPGEATPDGWQVALPADSDRRRAVRLRSRFTLPIWDGMAGADTRRLGVAVTAIALDDTPLPAGDPRRLSGWHAPEPDWQWTDGDATLEVGSARRLVISYVTLARYWRAPLLTA
jgi:hypothetical protein